MQPAQSGKGPEKKGAEVKDAKEKKSAEQNTEDFFTAYLAKKKKPLLKKIEKIESMAANTSTTLNKEQQDLVNRKQEILGQIAQFDEMREHYFTAMSKQEGETSLWLTPDAKMRGLLALYFSHGHISPEEAAHNEVAQSFNAIFKNQNYEDALLAAKKFADKKELNEYLANNVKSFKDLSHAKNAAPKEAPRKGSAKLEAAKEEKKAEHHDKHEKKEKHEKVEKQEENQMKAKFFNPEDDEEEHEHDEQEHHHHHAKQDDHGKKQPTSAKPGLILLPEGDKEEKEEWFNPNHRSGRGGRGGRGRGGYRGNYRGRRFNNRDRVPREHQGREEEGAEEHEGEQQKDNDLPKEEYVKRKDGGDAFKNKTPYQKKDGAPAPKKEEAAANESESRENPKKK